MVIDDQMRATKLYLNLKRKHYNDILSGKKKEEYRLVKKHWTNRIVGRQYTHIIFKNGHQKNSPTMEVEYFGYTVRFMQHEEFGSDPVSVYVLKLGKIKIIQ